MFINFKNSSTNNKSFITYLDEPNIEWATCKGGFILRTNNNVYEAGFKNLTSHWVK